MRRVTEFVLLKRGENIKSWLNCMTLLLFWFWFWFLFWDGVSLRCPGWSAMAWSRLTATYFPSSSDSPTSASWEAGITGAHHHIMLISVFLVEAGFQHIGKAGLELLDLNWSTCLGLPKCWDYRCELLCPVKLHGFLFPFCYAKCSLPYCPTYLQIQIF